MENKMMILGNIYAAGVYGMRCMDSQDYLYIGSGLEMNDCLSRHLHFLKRGLYTDTNKAILQEMYDKHELVFEVIKESCHDKISEMSSKEKEALHETLSVLEKFYIDLFKDTICNKQRTVTKHSSNKNSVSTFRRRKSNLGAANPNAKYDEKMIAEILWLKMNGYKAKQIEEFYKNEEIKSKYISMIGVTKWIHMEPVKPDFIA